MATEALANPRVLEWARRMAGLEEHDAARKLHVKPERLMEWEAGTRRPTITQLRKIADTYKRAVGIFFLSVPPPDEPIPTDFRRVDPLDEQPLSPQLLVAIRTARARRQSALDLFEELGESPRPFALRVRLGDNPETVGDKLRAALGVEANRPLGEPYANFNRWRAAAEQAGVLVFQAERVRVNEMRGFSISDHPLPSVVLNSADAPAGRTFSLLHELAHVALNKGGLCLLEAERPSSDLERVEVFCNHVAGAALLPASQLLAEPAVPAGPRSVLRDEEVTAIAARHGVSEEVVLRRLLILNRVTPEFYQSKRREFVQRYAALALRTKKKSKGGPPPARVAIARGGPFFTRLVLNAYESERITSSDVADLLGVRLKHLERVRSEVEPPSSRGRPRE